MCPYCGEELTGDAVDDSMRSVARISSLAEVGYFENVLHDAGIDAEVQEHEDFNAIGGEWSRTYVLRVAAARADEAVQLLEEALTSTSEPDEPSLFTRHADSSQWVAAGVFGLLVCGLMFLLVAAGDNRAAWPWKDDERLKDSAAGPAPALWRALAEDKTPLTDAREGKLARRKLYYDEHRDVLLLEEDFDGDGRIDRTRGFRGAGVILDHDW